jgi:hypothetical protein
MKTIKIISDRFGMKTKVLTSDGEELGYIQSIVWSVDTTDRATATIVFSEVEIEAVLEEPEVIIKKAESDRET